MAVRRGRRGPRPLSRRPDRYRRRPGRERGNLLNAILVVVALIALAGAGTTIYLVQLHDKPAATSETPTADATTGGGASQDGGGPVVVDDTAGATTTRAQSTTQRV